MAGMRCQKCRTPLKLDGSLEDLNPASFKILADAAPVLQPKEPDAPRSAAAKERRQLYDEASQEAGQPIHKRLSSLGQHSGSKAKPDMSYIMLSDSQIAAPDESFANETKGGAKKPPSTAQTGDAPLSQKMETVTRLFEIMSARSDIDQPVCSDCTELLVDGLQKRQSSVARERDAYVDFLKQVQRDIPTDEEKAQTSKDLEDAQLREKQALEELEALEAEKAKMEDEIAALDAEAEDLDEEEERFWRDRNAFTAELTAFQEERDSLQNQLAHDTKLLESLQRTNVYNDTFCIGHDGLFGTINGMRLGRLSEHPVEWAEINAAWGQAVLLLAVVAEKLGYTMQGYRLQPLGSTSKIEKFEYSQGSSNAQSRQGKPNVKPMELYCSGDLPLGLGFLHRNFDNAMVAFLDCLRQLGEHVERTSQTHQMPYKIVKDKINDTSIKLGNFGQEEQWTKACKYTLTCCKFLLAHASHVDSVSDSKPGR
ncbi:hypothetical protein MBLNU230_g4982t1 [Neophaeotheca triangularis]